MSMLLFPAIDLLGGQAVRLYQGDYAKSTVYHQDPVQVALAFERAGATHLHVVDLDAARSGEATNHQVVADIAKNTNLFVQVGGGIRDLNRAESYLKAGVRRVILGTAAAENRAFLQQAVAALGEQVAVGVDVRGGFVATRGWTHTTELPLHTFLDTLHAVNVRTLVVTDISRDGAMRGPNMALYQELQRRGQFQLVASGGVTTLEDLKALAGLSLYGAIVGKALYTGDIELKAAWEVLA